MESQDLYAVVCHHYHDDVDKRHFHCQTCEKIIKKKENLINHVKTCTGPVTTDGNEVTGNSTSDERLQASNGDENEQTRQVPPCVDKQNHDDHPDACKKKCDICGKLVHARWLKAHLKQHQKGMSTCGENHHHYTVSISPNEGIFCAAMNMKGPAYPVHIIKKTSGDNTQSFCDNLPCIELKETAKRGGNMALECSHLQSTPFAKQGRIINLKEDTLQEMRDKRFITEERHNELITFKNESTSDTSPLIVLIPQDQHTSQRHLYLSVYTGITRYWTKIGRTVVSYDNVERTFTCRCSTSKRYCVHKAIGKWFLFQEMPHCFSSEISSDDDGEEEHAPTKSESTDIEDKFKKCNAKENLNYLLTKKIPPKIPKLRDRVDIREFRPTEIECHICSGNLKEERCTNRGKIIMMTGVIRELRVSEFTEDLKTMLLAKETVYKQEVKKINEENRRQYDELKVEFAKMSALIEKISLQNTEDTKPNDCTDIDKRNGSGIYTVYPIGVLPFNVYCDMEKDNGGWTVFQRRINGQINFQRGWGEYEAGFGNLETEFWLGNKYLNVLTSQGRYELRVDLEDFDNNARYAKYSQFYIADVSTNYRLTVSNYNGNAGDSLTHHNGNAFSTKDRDNDKWTNNCAVTHKGAWWYGDCHHSNLNGAYLHGKHDSNADGVNWLRWKDHHYSLKTSIMMMRRG